MWSQPSRHHPCAYVFNSCSSEVAKCFCHYSGFRTGFIKFEIRHWLTEVMSMCMSQCFLHAAVTFHQFLSRHLFTCSSAVFDILLKWCHIFIDINRNAALLSWLLFFLFYLTVLELCKLLNLIFMSLICTDIKSFVSLQRQTAVHVPMPSLVRTALPAEPEGAGVSVLDCSWSRNKETR